MPRPLLYSVLIIVTIFANSYAKTKLPEKVYQNDWCLQQQGQPEVRLPDGTRADCLTATHAIEFDFGKKWAESIGQALYYSIQTGKDAGIVLILEKPSDRKYWLRLNSIIEHKNLDIKTWKVENF